MAQKKTQKAAKASLKKAEDALADARQATKALDDKNRAKLTGLVDDVAAELRKLQSRMAAAKRPPTRADKNAKPAAGGKKKDQKKSGKKDARTSKSGNASKPLSASKPLTASTPATASPAASAFPPAAAASAAKRNGARTPETPELQAALKAVVEKTDTRPPAAVPAQPGPAARAAAKRGTSKRAPAKRTPVRRAAAKPAATTLTVAEVTPVPTAAVLSGLTVVDLRGRAKARGIPRYYSLSKAGLVEALSADSR